jgi:P-type E1-E2 ATPase
MDGPKIFTMVVEYLTVFIAVILVAVPEGLPLSVSISLAYSFVSMKKEHILVKHPDALEKMGGVEEICTGKTATLTQNDMKLHAIYTQSRLVMNTKRNTFVNCNLYPEIINLVT